MSELVKATLQKIKADESATPIGDPIPVQFNPASLQLQITNNSSGGDTRGSQVRQHLGTSSTTLTLELVFDTADEGDTDRPRSVREKTDLVQQFVMPEGQEQGKQAPPKLSFQWGSLIVRGIVDSISINLDHFAADGTPLRAKVGLTIKEQDTRYQFLQSGAGANKQGANAAAPGQPTSTQPGALGGGIAAGFSAGLSAGISASASFGASAQFGVALGGESAAEFAARVGVDPAAWRGLATGSGSSSLSLEAGVEVGFSANLSASAGLGVSAGVGAGASASLETSFGLEVSAGVTAVAGVSARAETAAGFALSAAGGMSAALETVQIARSQSAEQQSRQAFAAPSPAQSLGTRGASSAIASTSLRAPSGPTTSSANLTTGNGAGANATAAARPSMPDQPRTALARTGLLPPARSGTSASAPPPPRADMRSATFGFGVPLRPTVGAAANLRAGYLQGSVPLRSLMRSSGNPPATTDPTTPPWVSLPVESRARDAADKLQRELRPCGCRKSCGCGRKK